MRIGSHTSSRFLILLEGQLYLGRVPVAKTCCTAVDRWSGLNGFNNSKPRAAGSCRAIVHQINREEGVKKRVQEPFPGSASCRLSRPPPQQDETQR